MNVTSSGEQETGRRAGWTFRQKVRAPTSLSIIHAFAVEYYPVHIRTTGVEWAAGMGRCGAIAGPSLGGALVAMSLPFQQNFLIFAAPGVIGAIAVALVAKRKYRDRMHQTATPAHVPSTVTL